MPKYPEVEKLWARAFKTFFNIDERTWPTQGPRLRELARILMALANVCDQLSPKEDGSGQKEIT